MQEALARQLSLISYNRRKYIEGEGSSVNQVVAITGGASGIGRAIACAFAKAGYKVSVADIHKEAGFEVIRMIRELGGQAMYVRCDISQEAEVKKWLALTNQDLGEVRILINNAGISRNGQMLEQPIADFDEVIRVNLRGTYLCSKYAAELMKEQASGGSIINIASTRALMSEADTEAYSASKGGIIALTHAMAVSLSRYRIRVNAISPGWIETGPWLYSLDAHEPRHTQEDLAQHPAGRVGEPNDIANACLFLANPHQSGFITGQNLIIDGGMTIKMIYE